MARGRVHPGSLRGARSFSRRPGNRDARKLALVVCEDGKLTPTYLRALCAHLRVSSASVSIPPNRGSAPISVVDFAAERFRRDSGYDRAFCVIDRDGHESYARAIARAEGYASRENDRVPMRTIISDPCVEYWFLVHFEAVTRPMRNCDDVIHALRAHVPGYAHGSPQIIEALLPLTDAAVRNARWVRREHARSDAANPVTHMDELINYLKALAQPLLA